MESSILQGLPQTLLHRASAPECCLKVSAEINKHAETVPIFLPLSWSVEVDRICMNLGFFEDFDWIAI